MEENQKKSFGEWVKENTIVALVCALVLGLLIGLGIMYFARGEIVATVSGQNITSTQLYNKMRINYKVESFLDVVDEKILKNKYKLDDKEYEKLKEEAESYIQSAVDYGYTETEFLNLYGFENRDDFIDYFALYYKKDICYYEYLETKLDENAVQDYYNERAFGIVNTKHILVETGTEFATDDEALAIAKEIIGRLDNGEDFDVIAFEYKQKYPDYVISEDLGEASAFSHLEQAYLDGMKVLNKGEHSTEPVKTSYGYHVIYCVDKTEKTDEINRTDKMEIIDALSGDILSENPNIYYEALIKLREDAGFKIYDGVFKEKYEDYLASFEDNNEQEVDEQESNEQAIDVEESNE